MSADKRCGTCAWWHPHSPSLDETVGTCVAPLPAWSLFSPKYATDHEFGAECRCWTFKTSEHKADAP